MRILPYVAMQVAIIDTAKPASSGAFAVVKLDSQDVDPFPPRFEGRREVREDAGRYQHFTRMIFLRSVKNDRAAGPLCFYTIKTHSGPAAPLRERMRLNVFSNHHDGQSASNRSGTCGQRERQYRQRQISKARQTSIGSAFVLRPRYLAVLSSFLHGPIELSASRQCLSKCGEPSSGVKTLRCNPRDPVPASMTQSFSRRFNCRPIGSRPSTPRPGNR